MNDTISQNQPTLEQQLEQIQNQFLVIDGKAAAQRTSLTNNLIQQVYSNGMNIKSLQEEINRLKDLCTKNKIDIAPPQPKQPNRAERRAVDKLSKKSK